MTGSWFATRRVVISKKRSDWEIFLWWRLLQSACHADWPRI